MADLCARCEFRVQCESWATYGKATSQEVALDYPKKQKK